MGVIAQVAKKEAVAELSGISFKHVNLMGDGDCFWRSYIYLMSKLGINVKDMFSLNTEKVAGVWMKSEELMTWCCGVEDLIDVLKDDFLNTKKSSVADLTMLYLAEMFNTSITLYSTTIGVVIFGDNKKNNVSIHHYDCHYTPIVAFQ